MSRPTSRGAQLTLTGSERIGDEDSYRLLRNFVSSLVWIEGHRASIVSAGGGSIPVPTRIPNLRHSVGSVHPVHFDNIPEPNDQRAKLALALYREAMEAPNIAYRFLGFYKIVNVIHAKGPQQKAWINANLHKVTGLGKERKDELAKTVADIGDYLFVSGRCAVAHAYDDPLVNPDEPSDYRRLSKDAPLIRELAEIAIEDELGVKSAHTIWQEHLYELAGFKELFGRRAVEALSKKAVPAEDLELPELPKLSIRIRDAGRFEALEAMDATPEGVTPEGGVVLRFSKASGIVLALVYLDFASERLRIDIEGGFAVYDNKTPDAARFAADVMRFKSRYFMNGSLEVWSTEPDRLLSRCDPFIPVNIMPFETSQNFERHAVRFDEIAVEREGADNPMAKMPNLDPKDTG